MQSHSKHVSCLTRRELIGRGLLSAPGIVLAPSLFYQAAFGAECAPPPQSLLPFLVIDCAGGAGLSGNWIVGKKGGPEDYLKTYHQLGVPRHPSEGEPIDGQFGCPLFRDLSKIRQGLLATLSENARKYLKMASLCVASQDDSSENELSPLFLVSRAGLVGKHLPTGVGTQGTPSGGRSTGPGLDQKFKPILIKGADDITQSLSYGSALSQFSVKQRERLAQTLAKLSSRQWQKWRSLIHAEELSALSECAGKKLEELAAPVQGLDPRHDPDCQAVYGLKPTSPSTTAKLAAIVYNVLQGHCGPGVITIEGCDYHDGTQNTGDTKDLEIGQTLGRAVELAWRLKKPLFFAVISDGSVYSDPGTRVWRGDAGSKGLAIMGLFDPRKPPELKRVQLGSYLDGQAVDRTSYIGNEPRRAALAIFLNYLAWQGKTGLFRQFVTERDFSLGEIDAHLVLG